MDAQMYMDMDTHWTAHQFYSYRSSLVSGRSYAAAGSKEVLIVYINTILISVGLLELLISLLNCLIDDHLYTFPFG